LIVFTAAFKLILTKFCRAQFDDMNITEASILCDIQPPESPQSPHEEAEAAVPGPNEIKLTHHDSVRFWTSRFTSPWHKYQFTSTNFKSRPHSRRPIPFVPSLDRRDTQSRYSMDDKERIIGSPSTTTEHLPSPVEPPAPSVPPLRIDVQHADAPKNLVSPHHPRLPWDDSPLIDKPYDNPFYKKPIDNVLWLPRKPWDILDLDDTVDMQKSLTSEPGTGQLGQWVEGTEESQVRSITSDQPESPVAERHELSPMRPGFPRRGLSGLEAIILPAIIAARVEDIEEETDVEDTGRTRSAPSIFGRRSTISSTRPSLPHRSHTLGAQHPSSSFIFRQQSRSRSRLRAGSLSQAEEHLSPASGLGVLSPGASSSESSVLSPPAHIREDGRGGVTRSVTTRQAVVGEVLAEEQVATADRMRRERDYEPKQASGSRSWLTAWLYQHKRRRGDQTPEEYIQ